MDWLDALRKSWSSHELNPTWVIAGELGKSWPGVFSWDPQYLQKEWEEQWPLSAHFGLGVELEGSLSVESDWPFLETRITLPWLVLDLPLCIKDPDILALDYVAERLLLRLNAVAAGNISEGICSFIARCHCCLCLPAQGSHSWGFFSAEGVLPHQSCTGDLLCPLALAAAGMFSSSTGSELWEKPLPSEIKK